MDFIEFLEDCRGSDSQEEFAIKLGCTQAAISRILNRKRRPSVSVLQSVIAAYPDRRDDAVRLFLALGNDNCHAPMHKSMEAPA